MQQQGEVRQAQHDLEPFKQGLAAPRILIIDDDRDDAYVLSQMILHSEYKRAQITIVDNADDALGLVFENKFDVALVDYWLGAQTSVQVLRNITINFGIPAIVLSGLDTDEIRKIGLQAGALGFLAKSDLSRANISKCLCEILRGEARKQSLLRVKNLDINVAALEAIGPWMASLLSRTERVDRLIAIRRMEKMLEADALEEEKSVLARIASEVGFIRRELMLRLDRIGQLEDTFQIRNQEFELTEILRDVRNDFRFDAQVRSVKFSLIGTDEKITMNGDPLLLRDLFLSLFLNSLDMIDTNSELVVTVDQDDENVYAAIQEHRQRTSIHEIEALLHRFEPSASVAEMMSTPEGARLQLASQIAEVLGGTIDLDSNDKEGTTLVVTLPKQIPIQTPLSSLLRH